MSHVLLKKYIYIHIHINIHIYILKFHVDATSDDLATALRSLYILLRAQTRPAKYTDFRITLVKSGFNTVRLVKTM